VIVNVRSEGEREAGPAAAAEEVANALQFGERVRLVQNSPIMD
jgi:hypothetical protein